MSQQATFRFDRNGRPLVIVILATYNIRTTQVTFSVTSSTTGASLGNNLLGNQVLSVLNGFANEFPSDASQIESARQFVIQAQQSLIAANQTQGPGTESAGETVAEAQEAKANGASSQSPADPAQKANAQGEIANAPASTVPSNADPATGTDSISSEAPSKLPEASLATSSGSLTNDAGTGPVSTVLQVTTPDISAPEANNNLVSYIYRATRVVSRFQQGKFTQEIEGFQIFFPSPGQTNTAGAPASNAANAPNAARAATAPARPQTTVVQTATTPGALGYLDGGVTFQNQVGAEFGAFFGDGTTGEPGQRLNRSTPGPGDQTPRSLPASSFAAEGFVDPTQEQPDTVAPLKINPPTTDGGSVVSPPRRSRSNANRDSQSNTTNTALQQGAREY